MSEEEESEYDPEQEETGSEEEEDQEEEEEDYSIEDSESDDIDEPPQQLKQAIRKAPTKKLPQQNPPVNAPQSKSKASTKRKSPIENPSKTQVKKSKSAKERPPSSKKSVEKTETEPSVNSESSTTTSSSSSGLKKNPIIFNDGNVDVNLYTLEAQNIVKKKIKISSNLMILSQIIENWDNKNYNQEYAALTIQRKLKDGKAFEFNVPLNLAYSLQNAIQIIIDHNPKFFSGIKRPKTLVKNQNGSNSGTGSGSATDVAMD